MAGIIVPTVKSILLFFFPNSSILPIWFRLDMLGAYMYTSTAAQEMEMDPTLDGGNFPSFCMGWHWNAGAKRHSTARNRPHHTSLILERVESIMVLYSSSHGSKENKRKYQVQGLESRWRVSACRRFIRVKHQPGWEKQFFFWFLG